MELLDWSWYSKAGVSTIPYIGRYAVEERFGPVQVGPEGGDLHPQRVKCKGDVFKVGSRREAAVSHLVRMEWLALLVRPTKTSLILMEVGALLTASSMVSLVS